MVQACSEIVATVVKQLNSEFKSVKSSSDVEWLNLEQNFLSFRDLFDGLKNTYQQTAYIKQLGVYVEPEEYVIAGTQAFVTDRKAKFCKPVLHKVTGQYVSIKKMLMTLHK